MAEILALNEDQVERKFVNGMVEWTRILSDNKFAQLMRWLSVGIREDEKLSVLSSWLHELAGTTEFGIVRVGFGDRKSVRVAPENVLLREGDVLKRNNYGLYVVDANSGGGWQIGLMIRENRLNEYRMDPSKVVDCSGLWMGIVGERVDGFKPLDQGPNIERIGGVDVWLRNDGGVLWRRQGVIERGPKELNVGRLGVEGVMRLLRGR